MSKSPTPEAVAPEAGVRSTGGDQQVQTPARPKPRLDFGKLDPPDKQSDERLSPSENVVFER